MKREKQKQEAARCESVRESLIDEFAFQYSDISSVNSCENSKNQLFISQLYEEIKRQVQIGGTLCLKQFDSFGDKLIESEEQKIQNVDHESQGSSQFQNLRWDMKSNKLVNSYNNSSRKSKISKSQKNSKETVRNSLSSKSINYKMEN